MQQLYSPIREDLIVQRIAEVRAAGVVTAAALSPQRTDFVVDAGVDLFVIRGTTVSAEHVSSQSEPLNLERFIVTRRPVVVGGVATYTCASTSCGPARRAGRLRWRCTPQHHVGRSRRRGADGHRGGRCRGGAPRLHGRVGRPLCARHRRWWGGQERWHRQGDRVWGRCRRHNGVRPSARASDAPTRRWGTEAHHHQLPRGERVRVGVVGTLEEVLVGPSSMPGTLDRTSSVRCDERRQQPLNLKSSNGCRSRCCLTCPPQANGRRYQG